MDSKPSRSKRARAQVPPVDALSLRLDDHLKFTCAKRPSETSAFDQLNSLCRAVRDLAVERMLATQRQQDEADAKRVHYLSMEFLIGRLLTNNIISLGLGPAAEAALRPFAVRLEELAAAEPDAGLGNGGLGRLAACFLDSLATLELPAIGQGLRYQHGMFRQEFDNGWQMERPDDWLRHGNPWEIIRPEDAVPVLAYGHLESLPGPDGTARPVWVGWQMIEGVPYDVPVIGYGVNTVNVLRLWSARAAEGFRLDVFNAGDYVRAVEEKNWAENITKVLYPSENTHAGKELRLLQEYFLVACAVRDAVRRHLRRHPGLDNFAEKHALQLNDTHPALAVAELMRHLVDEHDVPWGRAWEITVDALGYTNHTLLPEALEKWSVPLFERLLPRHLQIIYEANHRFLEVIRVRYPDDTERVRRLSLIEETPVRQVRMANLAIIGSHAVNGVARLHSDLLRTRLVPEFAELWPERFTNKTNGITPRRWLLACNPGLAGLITEAIGDAWVRDLDALRALEPFAADPEFRRRFLAVKQANKQRLADLAAARHGMAIDPASLFDTQVKRLHEYKRQLLNALHIAALYLRLRDDPDQDIVPRTFVFGAKAAPGYHLAKRIIKFINSLGEILAADPAVRGRLRVLFLPDYCVSLAETIIPAADLSEQISTAGKEASGTGNMKLALNGALTMGTWDGATIEIAEAVGLDNIFIFGHRAEAIEALARDGYRPEEWLERDPELARVVASLRDGTFDRGQRGMFDDLHRTLTEWGDPYFHLADFRSYVEAQERATTLFRDPSAWATKAVLNVARMGPFSSDRSIREYARDIWRLQPVPITLSAP